ncbi:MAG: glutamine synthetase III [Bacteroidota bacterium]
MTPRYQALALIRKRSKHEPEQQGVRPSELFGVNVFSRKMMKKYLSLDIFEALQQSIVERRTLDRAISGPVANGIKAWAIDHGVTHYTHWFQPLGGRTAEKHESFLALTDGEVIEKFSGEELSQQEPDASAFPSGGLRRTFEARGFTAWDCSSPIFISESDYGKTLCIPTIFVSYNGEALDYKIPLLKSIASLNQIATQVAHYFEPNVKRVYPSLGMEQEYFLVDEALYELRPDLVQTGRTLFGYHQAHSFQSGEQYAAAIPERIRAFFSSLESRCLKLGIPLKTRHNELAPGQFEVVPQYEPINVAIDHGLMLMELIDKLAREHGFRAILHEKPFQGLNGSGKHSNWSLHTDTGINLLAPGKDPMGNLMFLTFFVAVLKAVATHSELFRASIASAGNDLRLGNSEAPPSILSVFVGQYLGKILQDIENPPRRRRNDENSELMHLGISEIPEILLGNTDTNRTAPFAFTGNKVEFRAVGAADNSSFAMTVLHTTLSQQLQRFKRRVDSKMNRGRVKESALLDMIREYISESKDIVLEGDSYSEAWIKETKKRKLFDPPHTPAALEGLNSESARKLFAETKLFSDAEISARHQILLESYQNQLSAEADSLYEIGTTQVIPLALDYQRTLFESIQLAGAAGFKNESVTTQRSLAGKIGKSVNELYRLLENMKKVEAKLNTKELKEKAYAYAESILPFFDQIRGQIDFLEQNLPDEKWPFPKYRELLFSR